MPQCSNKIKWEAIIKFHQGLQEGGFKGQNVSVSSVSTTEPAETQKLLFASRSFPMLGLRTAPYS